MAKASGKNAIIFPAVVLIDQREKLPFGFDGLTASEGKEVLPLLVRTRTTHLMTGDYTLEGYERAVAIERKGISDLYGTVGQGRDRFVRELARLADFRFAAVVVEAEWGRVIDDPPRHSGLKPKAVYRSVLAWQQRYPRVHWWFCPGREFAEYTTFRILDRFLRDRQAEAEADEGSSQNEVTP